MKYQHRLSRNIRCFYFNSVFNGLIAILAPIIVIFQIKDLGLSLGQILLGESIMALAILMTEIPSGIIADKYGRKRCLLIAESCVIISLAIFALADSFIQIALAQSLFGIAIAFSSGAKDALIYDSLYELGIASKYRKIKAHLNTLLFTIMILSNIASGLLAARYGFRLPLLLSSGFSIASLISLSFLTETRIQHCSLPESSFLHYFHSARKHILSSSLLFWLIIFSMIIGLGMKLSFQTLNPYWELRSIPIALFGIALASHNALAALMSHIGPSIAHRLGEKKLLGICLVFISSTFIALSHFELGIIGTIALSSLFQIPRALLPLSLEDLLHQHSQSHIRATIISFKSFAQQGSQALLLPLLGYTADIIGLLETFLWIGLIIIMTGIIPLLRIRKA